MRYALSEEQRARSEFVELFGRLEHDLKRSSFLKVNRSDAQADWAGFAEFLGEQFFAEVQATGVADTLINQPPARLGNDLRWHPQEGPLQSVERLFINGVLRVRNSVVHGEKFVRPGQHARDLTLVREALAVLKLAEQWRASVGRAQEG